MLRSALLNKQNFSQIVSKRVKRGQNWSKSGKLNHNWRNICRSYGLNDHREHHSAPWCLTGISNAPMSTISGFWWVLKRPYMFENNAWLCSAAEKIYLSQCVFRFVLWMSVDKRILVKTKLHLISFENIAF